MRALRRKLTRAERDKAALRAATLFLRQRKLARSQRVAVYLATGAELDPVPLTDALLRAGRAVFVPKLPRTGRMQLVRLRASSPLRRGRHGIDFPVDHAPRTLLRQLDLIVLPLLAFDNEGRRLGSGGASYDRRLAARRAFRRPLLVGYAYSQQGVARVPEENWDQRLDAVVTDEGVVWFKGRRQ